MKYFGCFIISTLLLFGLKIYFAQDISDPNWKTKYTLVSPNKHTTATVKCLDEGGATVGFYCKLYFEDQNHHVEKMMTVRDENISIKWIGSNVSEVTLGNDRPIYDFNSVYWNDSDKTQYFIRLKYK